VGTAIVHAELVHRNDVRVLQPPGDPSFFHETSNVRFAECRIRRQHLDGDIALELSIEGSDHSAHPTPPDQLSFDESSAREKRGTTRDTGDTLRLEFQSIAGVGRREGCRDGFRRATFFEAG
jgi:hypothetical protein